MRVEIVDDTGRSTIGRADDGPTGKRMMMAQDRQGRRLQEKTQTVCVFEDRHLDLAVLRARRWIRNAHKRRDGIRGAPKHIALKLAAFHKAYPVDFGEAMENAAIA